MKNSTKNSKKWFKDIFPSSDLLRLPALIISHVGMFPSELVFLNNKFYQKIYEFYTKLMLVFYIYITITMWIKLYLLFKEDELKIAEITKNLTTTILCTVAISRQFVMRLNSGFLENIKKIIEFEKFIFSTTDKKVLKIYNTYKNIINFNSVSYLAVSYLLTLFYLLRPFFLDKPNIIITTNNETIKMRNFPMSAWVPFDEQAYFWLAYIWNCIMTTTMTGIVCSADIFMFLLIIYPVGLLKILHHVMENFEQFMEIMKITYKTEKIDAATFKACIQIHKDIIRYVNNLNACMSIFMVIDFIQSSLLLTSVLAQLLWNPPSVKFYSFVFLYVIYLNQRVFINYYYSNEVWLLSENLSESYWQSKWYENSAQVKFMMQIFIIQTTRRPLKLNIGPFGYMSLSTYVAILKTTYSYITLLSSVKE